jgi:RTX calcium-binding nonapeptide repeat (4 copies)
MARLVGGLVALGVLLMAAPAHSAVGCLRGGAVLAVTVTEGSDVRLSVGDLGGGVHPIVVFPDNSDIPVACTNGSGTTNTINTIQVIDGTVGGGSTLEIVDPVAFAPGADAEPAGDPAEIEFVGNLGDGVDALRLQGGLVRDRFRAGTDGVNLNVDAEPPANQDPEITTAGIDVVTMLGGDGNDELSLQGGAGTGDASPLPGSLFGQQGNDLLDGNEAQNIMSADIGDDQLLGRGGDDFIAPNLGDDTADAGTGDDEFVSSAELGVRLDLALSGPQNTGEGVDTVTGFEDVIGGDSNDVVRGTDGANDFILAEGDDIVEGRGGDDTFSFGEEGDLEGADTVSYASAPAGVTVNLGSADPQDTGGAGVDTFFVAPDFVIGSEFADTLMGTAVRNIITGGGGADTISALDGDDRLELRDGTGDSGDCGPGNDTAIADLEGTDTLTACEIADFAPFLPDTTAPAFAGAVQAQPARFLASRRAPTDLGVLAARRGTRFVYELSEPASAGFVFQRRTTGRRVRGRCRKTTRRIRGRRRCTRFVRAGSLGAAASGGVNRTRFNGIVRGRPLKPGRYRALVTASDEAGNRSATASVSFRVLKPRPRRNRRA